uniref:Uncharacterized protein n=1 Tax=Oryza brachyantha TaxID=4533 RepID=J3MKD5_ORYBR
MEVTGKMPARVKRIRFADSQIECEVMLPLSVAGGGASSSMAGDQAAQRKPKRKRCATSADKDASGDDDKWESMGNEDVDFAISDTDDDGAHADGPVGWEVNESQ